MKIYVEEAVFSLFPFLTLFCLKACFDPALPLGEEKEERLKKELECAEKRARLREEKMEGLPLADPAAPWREGFEKFTSEKGSESCLESLLREARQGRVRPAGNLERLADAVSLDFSVPLGCEDASKIRGSLGLCLSRGRDPFQAPEGKQTLTREGEVCYLDKLGAVRRCINWENSQRTSPSPSSRRFLFLSESLDKDCTMRTGEAMRDLEKRLRFYFGAETEEFSLSSLRPSKRV
ncbi:MAG: hypothetical protein IIY17_02260 [Aeriscardovia sp.]|nr:hypothetical protein [Aeriscardovia sp.]